jgi:hypothetical protein
MSLVAHLSSRNPPSQDRIQLFATCRDLHDLLALLAQLLSRHEASDVRLSRRQQYPGNQPSRDESSTNLAFCNCFLDLFDLDLAEPFDLEQRAARSCVDGLGKIKKVRVREEVGVGMCVLLQCGSRWP